MKTILFLINLCFLPAIFGLDNGLALTPPMGWLHWQRFRCLTNCTLYPGECISEDLFKTMADLMVIDGYLAAGYEYLIIDDCWLATERDAGGRLQPDPDRFPNGIKALADYVHGKGLKFGIYANYGNFTCAGYPGSIDHLELDANTFAEWGVDYLKLDACYADLEGIEAGYTEMAGYLNNTDRPIVFSCSFPAYQGTETNYSAVQENCNLWRNYIDILDAWSQVQNISKWCAMNQDYLNQFAGPGHWNDPDMLIIGNYGLSLEQSKAQMTIWSLLAAPLIMSVDLRTIEPQFRNILLNTDVIRINQDPLGIPGRFKLMSQGINIWAKPILPKILDQYSYGVGFTSDRGDGYAFRIGITLDRLGLNNTGGYRVRDIFEQKIVYESVLSTDPVEVRVRPSGAVFWELTPLTIQENPENLDLSLNSLDSMH